MGRPSAWFTGRPLDISFRLANQMPVQPDSFQAMRFVWRSLDPGSFLMIVWVVIGSLTCIRLIGGMGAKARAGGGERGWDWLIFSAIPLFLLSNVGGALTWSISYGRYDPGVIPRLLLAFGGVVMLGIPFLIGGALSWGKMHFYMIIWGIYLLWGMTVFSPWVRFCRDPFASQVSNGGRLFVFSFNNTGPSG